MERKCEWCGGAIVGRDRRARLCSAECLKKRTSERLKRETVNRRAGRKCLVCGKCIKHRMRQALTCSDECRDRRTSEQQKSQRAERNAGKKCKRCAADIVGRSALAKFCSAECQTKHHAAARAAKAAESNAGRKCKYCDKEIAGRNSRAIFCSDRCTGSWHRAAKAAKNAADKLANGFYVYAWYDGDDCLYVGKGVNGRAHKKHGDYLCQKLRDAAKDFRVEILTGGESEESSRTIERFLIDLWNPPGNVATGMLRAPKMDDDAVIVLRVVAA